MHTHHGSGRPCCSPAGTGAAAAPQKSHAHSELTSCACSAPRGSCDCLAPAQTCESSLWDEKQQNSISWSQTVWSYVRCLSEGVFEWRRSLCAVLLGTLGSSNSSQRMGRDSWGRDGEEEERWKGGYFTLLTEIGAWPRAGEQKQCGPAQGMGECVLPSTR